MKLKRFLLRYYPPGLLKYLHFRLETEGMTCTGIILEYELRDKTREMKEIDLLHLTSEYALSIIAYFFLML